MYLGILAVGTAVRYAFLRPLRAPLQMQAIASVLHYASSIGARGHSRASGFSNAKRELALVLHASLAWSHKEGDTAHNLGNSTHSLTPRPERPTSRAARRYKCYAAGRTK